MSTPATPSRRSSRRRRSRGDRDAGSGPLSQWRHLGQLWRQQYIDLGHSRISRCTRRLADASADERDELRPLGVSFVALAVTAAASSSGRVRAEKERDLMEYVRTVANYDLPVNDEHRGESAVELAAYHGLVDTLAMLLELGCPLRKETSRGHAVHAAMRNGRHVALEFMLAKRTSEARRIIFDEERQAARSGMYLSTLMETITKRDAVGAQLLLSYGCASMSDLDARCIYSDTRRFKRHKKLERLLQGLHPTIPNVKHWRGELHWSFPRTDRGTLNWLWHAMRRSANSCAGRLPPETWLRVFSFVGRGWFASHRYDSVGRAPGGDVLPRNIIESTAG